MERFATESALNILHKSTAYENVGNHPFFASRPRTQAVVSGTAEHGGFYKDCPALSGTVDNYALYTSNYNSQSFFISNFYSNDLNLKCGQEDIA